MLSFFRFPFICDCYLSNLLLKILILLLYSVSFAYCFSGADIKSHHVDSCYRM